jgi:hypothetical protein
MPIPISAFSNAVHPLKALVPNEVTASGMVMDVNAVHPLKASLPNEVNASERVMDLSAVHPLKVLGPNVVNELGRVMDSSAVHPWKPPSNKVNPSEKVTDDNAVQFMKAVTIALVLSPIVTLVRKGQFRKARLSICLVLTITDAKLLQA